MIFLVCIDLAVTRTALLWGKSGASWVAGGIDRIWIWQTYDVARKLYHPRRQAPVRVAILGNSRAWFPARDAYVERELGRLDPGLDVRVDNLAIFGLHIGDLEIISRHLAQAQPTLVIVTLGGADLVPTSWGKLVNPTGELLDIGWSAQPLAEETAADRVDRWARTVWPLYRFRRFAREVIADRVSPVPGDREFPDHLTSHQEYFDFVHGKTLGAKVGAAYREWREDGTLAGFVGYLGVTGKSRALTEPVPAPETLTPDSPGVRLLDQLLARLAAGPWSTIVLLMPENPLLADDADGTYHRPGFSDRMAGLITETAARYGIPVVDGRTWLPADAFADFVHVFPDLSGFQRPLAQEILHALGS
jgi:hypothetical protein